MEVRRGSGHDEAGRSGPVVVASDVSAQVVAVKRELPFTPPFRLDLTAWALRRRSRNRIDVWDGHYRRALVVDGGLVTVGASQGTTAGNPTLGVTLTGKAEDLTEDRIAKTCQLLRRTLGLDANLSAFYRLTRHDEHLAGLVRQFRGMRPPQFPTVFEGLVNAVACQQFSLEVGIELLNRLTDAYGMAAPGAQPPSAAFPEPATLASLCPPELRQLGFSTQKSRTLIGLGEADASGQVTAMDLDSLNVDQASRALQGLSGIGRWSAEYVLLRGLGRLSVYPGDDVGARNKLRALLGDPGPLDYEGISRITARWKPFAGMVYFHLLLAGLADRNMLSKVTP